MKEVFEYFFLPIAILIFCYLVFRFSSAGYYRSKRNFIEWYKHYKEEREN